MELKQVAEGVWVHESEFLKSNGVVVQGKTGVLLIDPGITSDEMDALANSLHKLSQPVVAGFSTHPHWDHLLWHVKFGEAPRYATARNAASIKKLLLQADWKAQVSEMLPPENADQIPLDDLFGKVTGLPPAAKQIPWDGPKVRIIEHQAHASGHASLLIKDRGVLVAGDLLSDILIPFLDLEATDPIDDYLTALKQLEGVVDDVKLFIPGHGSVGDANQMRARIKQDCMYVQALRDGGGSNDPRLTKGPNKEWLPSVHGWQVQQLAKKREHDRKPE
jgi:glyoxylase-like metal-dependent hydrolase (beta-lactamase superfamily II)